MNAFIFLLKIFEYYDIQFINLFYLKNMYMTLSTIFHFFYLKNLFLFFFFLL